MSDLTIERIDVNDRYTVKIEYDTFPIHPRNDCDNFTTLALFSRGHNLVNESDYDINNYDSWNNLYEDIISNEDIAVIMPVSMYEHGGVIIHVGDIYQFADWNWDASRIGYAFVTKQVARKEYGWKRITSKRREQLRKMINADIDEYSDFVGGYVYSYKIFDNEIDDIVDSGYNFYGLDNCKEIALESIKYLDV